MKALAIQDSGASRGVAQARGSSELTARARRHLSSTLGQTGARLLVLGIIFGFWEVASGHLLPRVWVSSPLAILAKLASWVLDGSLWPHLGATLLATSFGYAVGCASGVASGLLLGLMPRVQRVLRPFITALYSLPKPALAPLFVIFLGIGLESKIALVAITVFFLLLYNTLDGVRDLDRQLLETFRIMGAAEREIALKVVVPGVLPWIFSGLRIGVRYAFTAAVIGELIAGNQGIGFLIERSAGQYNASGVFAGVLVLVLCSVAVTELISRAETSALHWRP